MLDVVSSIFLLSLVGTGGQVCEAFSLPTSYSSYANNNDLGVRFGWSSGGSTLILSLSSSSSVPNTPDDGNGDEDLTPDPDGASLAAELFQLAQAKGVSLEEGDLLDDDYDDDIDDDDEDDDPSYSDDSSISDSSSDYSEEEGLGEQQQQQQEATTDIPQVDLTNDQLYSEVRERVLDTAGGFVDMVRGPSEDDDDDDDDDGKIEQPKAYVPPETVPDSELTAGEVVLLVLEALKNNDTPTKNKGTEILFGYSSEGSQIKNEVGLTPAEYSSFLKDTGYEALFNHLDVKVEKGEYSHNGKKGYFTARLQTGPSPKDSISCNFILSTEDLEDDSVWLIDSILIRPQSMRRRRRK